MSKITATGLKKNALVDATLYKYVIVGVLNTLLNIIITFGLLHLLKVNYLWSYFWGTLITVVSSFVLNRYFTFKSSQHWHHEAFKFFIAVIISYLLSNAWLIISVNYFKIPYNYALSVSMGVYTTINYLLNKKLVFKNKMAS